MTPPSPQPGIWQNKRESDVFSDDGGLTHYTTADDGPTLDEMATELLETLRFLMSEYGPLGVLRAVEMLRSTWVTDESSRADDRSEQ